MTEQLNIFDQIDIFLGIETKEQKAIKKIFDKYNEILFNENNFDIGGGLDGEKFASRRHEDAKGDNGKLTEGEATQLFKKATGESLEVTKEVINFAVPSMEWHHAGKLPKKYGGGMKKTYFVNAKEICFIAENWYKLVKSLELHKIEIENKQNLKKNFEERKNEFLKSKAKKITRSKEMPKYFIKTAQEMEGKHGWFDSSYKSYNLTEYFTGWEFDNEDNYKEYFNIK